jgi:hypothetical protein
LSKTAENNLNLFDTKGYERPTGDVSLQKRTDLARIPLNLPHFSKTSLVPSHVYSIEHLFKRPYAVKDCPENPLTSYIYRCPQPLKRSVKTRRNSLSDNKVYLQIGDAGLITAETQRWRRDAQRRKTESYFCKGKGKNSKKEFIYEVAVPLPRNDRGRGNYTV